MTFCIILAYGVEVKVKVDILYFRNHTAHLKHILSLQVHQ